MMSGVTLVLELAELMEGSHLNPQHVLELWTQRQRASWSPDFTTIRDRGPDNCIEQAPHHPMSLDGFMGSITAAAPLVLSS